MQNYAAWLLSAALLLCTYGSETVFAQESGKKQMLVVFEEEIGKQEAIQAVESAGGRVVDIYEHVEAASVEIPSSSADELLQHPFIKYAEEDVIIQLSEQVEDWGIQAARIPAAWQSGFTGAGVKVAVIDTGIALHSDLTVAGGVSTVDDTSSYYDDNGHGTHVAGIIGAQNNSLGVKGVAFDSEIYAVKAFNKDGAAYLSDLIEGIDWAISNDIDIVNISSGTQTESFSLRSVVNKAYESGLLIVAAAGNDGAPDGLEDTVDFPAGYPAVIGVGAVDASFQRASFSSTGPEVELAAPGAGILSTYLGNQYGYMSGTSMAAPYVAGKLALLKQAYPRLSNEELRQVMIEHTLDLGEIGRDPFFGYGFIQASSFTEPRGFQEENTITGLALSNSSVSGEPGETVTVSASALYQNGDPQNVTSEASWFSDNPAVAVAAMGKIELKGYGSTTITVTYEGQSAVIIVNVPEPVQEANPVVKLEVSPPTSLVGKPGETINVVATAIYESGEKRLVTSEATWSSADPAVAAADKGKVELKGYGSTTITVTYEDKSTMLVVNSPEPQPSPAAEPGPSPSPDPGPSPSPSPSPDPGPAPAEPAPKPAFFQDVPLAYAPAVEYLVRNQITQGISKTEFGISKDIIRADAAIWLARELNLNTESARKSSFTDVPERAAGAVNALKAAGVIGGKTETQFGAGDFLTRGEMALILQRAYQLSSGGKSSAFTDVSSRYKEAVDALVAHKVTYGLTAVQFGVHANITRGQLAIFLYRLSSR